MKNTLTKIYLRAACAGLACAVLAVLGCVQPLARYSAPTITPFVEPTAPPTPAPTPVLNTPRPPTPTPARPTPTPAPQALEIQGPVDGSRLRGKAVVVHGVTAPGSAISVNGQPARVDGDGRFLAELLLPEGLHQISVASVDSLGNLQIRTVNVILEPAQPFFLLVTEPSAAQTVVFSRNVRLAGRTGVGALVSVNGVSIGVDSQGAFATSLTLDPGPNIIDVLSTSPEGQVESIILAIIYRA